MKREDRLCAFVIPWILLPRGSNHAQLTTEDICLIHALKENIQPNWVAIISDNMIKVTRFTSAKSTYNVTRSTSNH